MISGYRPEYDIGESKAVDLLGRGTTAVWDSGTSGAAHNRDERVVLLLHGWNVDAPTTYGFSFPHLSKDNRVVMFDQHGHGEGIRNDEPFTIEDAANDAVAVLDALDIPSAVVVGYSLGGAVAQTLLKHHPERCAGIVLSATSARFAESAREQKQFQILAGLPRLVRKLPTGVQSRVNKIVLAGVKQKYPEWIAEVVGKADMATLLEAGGSMGTFNANTEVRPVQVPSAFVVTATDAVVPPDRQVRLATALDVDSMHSVHAGHEVPIRDDPEFNQALVEAVRTVADAANTAR